MGEPLHRGRHLAPGLRIEDVERADLAFGRNEAPVGENAGESPRVKLGLGCQGLDVVKATRTTANA